MLHHFHALGINSLWDGAALRNGQNGRAAVRLPAGIGMKPAACTPCSSAARLRACNAFALACCTAWPQLAGAEGRDVLSIGWVYLEPNSSSGPLTVTSIGGQPVHQPQAGTGLQVQAANTALLSWEHYWDDHLSTQAVLGYPPTFDTQGTGTLAPFGKLGSAQQWSPALLMKWHFREAAASLRPYLGIGLNYTWFRRSRITNEAFVATFYGPDATTSASASSSWNPVYTTGVDYRLDSHWSIGASFSYAPLKTQSTVEANNTQFGVPVVVTTDVQLRTWVAGLNLGYRF